MRRGEARVVVGARSALFLPFSELGLIIGDEEHEQAYKQEDGVIYHARDMAVVRARIENCPIVLASATPSLETFVNATSGRYHWLKLPRRHGRAVMPEIRLVDLRSVRVEPGTWLSQPLRDALAATLASGEQAMLFLNRRGYAPLTLCESCGQKMVCRSCSAWLVEHRYQRRLACHHCGFEMPIPLKCPHCEAEKCLIACGPGVERVAEEFAAAFPQARAAIASSDTMHGPLETQAAIRAIRETIAATFELDARPEGLQRGGSPRHVVAVGEPAHRRLPRRERPEEKGAVRHRLVARDAQRAPQRPPTLHRENPTVAVLLGRGGATHSRCLEVDR